VQEEQLQQMIQNQYGYMDEQSTDCIDFRQNWQNDKETYDTRSEVDTLMKFCLHFGPCCGTLPQLSSSWENGLCKGLAQINIFGVPHILAGKACKDEDTASIDVASRVLWYLQCPAFAEKYEVDMENLAACAQVIPVPPPEFKASLQ